MGAVRLPWQEVTEGGADPDHLPHRQILVTQPPVVVQEQLPPPLSAPPMGWLQDDGDAMPVRRMLPGLRVPPAFMFDDGYVPSPLVGHEVIKMGIDPTNPTTATIYWQPAAILVAHDEHTVLIEGLVRVGGTRVHIDQTGMIHIMVIDLSSG